MLTQTRLKELLHYAPDTGVFTWLVNRGSARVGMVAGTSQGTGYIWTGVAGGRHLNHRLAWLYMTGNEPENCVDHVNGVTDDNRWCNLRAATVRQNQLNRVGNKKGNISGYKCVFKGRGSWFVGMDGHRVHGFNTAEDANEFACLMREMLHGEFACHERSAA